MNRCLKLAYKGVGKTSPNPLVGCVVLDKNGKVISQGYHSKCGKNHAERDALLKTTPEIVQGGTLIVNLEPCSHYGKTPPCVDIILEYGIKKVVIGMRDPNPKTQGVLKLKNAGVEIIEGVMEKECKQLNEIFIVNQEEKRTFVAIKTATTLDGKIATSNGSSKWITFEATRLEARKIRKKYDAILTSSVTVNSDNPIMKHPKKIILDRKLSTDPTATIYKQGEIIVFYDENLTPKNIKGVTYLPAPVIDGALDVEFILHKLYELGIMSVMVESGGKLSGAFLPYADKIYNFISPKIVGDNSAKSSFDYRKVFDISEAEEFSINEIKTFSPDILLVLDKKSLTS